MMSIEDIQTNSAKLRGLNLQIEETFRKRDYGPEERARWETACTNFHSQFDELCFPGGSKVFDQVKTGNSNAVESAIRFLTADTRHFRSGYMKEYLWRVIPRLKLSPTDVARLEGVALQYLRRQISREFWYMCRAMARIGTPDIWRKVTQLLGAEESLVAKRASYLLAFSVNVHAGARVQRQVYKDVLHQKYGRA